MGKYIEADRLYKDITRNIDYCEDILEIVERQPAADVVEVRHGHWIDVNGDRRFFGCSVCGEISCCNQAYCNECGAKMDEVTE